MMSGPARSATTRETANEWLGPGRFAALLGLLILATFPQVTAGLEALAYGDAGLFAYPVAFYHRACFWRGELPLWNPYNSCGIPFLAQWNTLVFYPPSLCYLLLPLPWSFGVFCLAHLFLAGVGMYYLAARWTGRRLPAAVAGAAFAFNGFTWYGLMWPHLLAGLAWMPWVVLCLESAWRSERRSVLVAGLVGAVQLLSGGAEAIVLTWLIVGALGLRALAAREVSLRQLVRRGSAAGLLAAGLAAVQLLPFLDLLVHSQRGAGYASGRVAEIAALPLSGWLNYLVPLFHTIRNSTGVYYVQSGQTWVGSYYLGIGTVALAVLAVLRARGPRVWLLAGLALFGFGMALGPRGPLHTVVSRFIPLFGFIRFPFKFLILTTFGLPLLAAFGLNWLEAAPAGQSSRRWRSLGLIGLALLAVMAGSVGYAWQNPFPGNPLLTVAGSASLRALFLVVLAGLAWRRPPSMLRMGWVFEVGFVVVLWFDVFTHASNLSPTVAPATLEPNVIRQFFKWEGRLEAGGSRVLQDKASLRHLLAGGSPNLQEDMTSRRLALFMNLNLLDGVPKFDGFYSTDVREYFELFRQVFASTNDPAPLRDFLGISHVSNPTNAVDWVPRDTFLPLLTAGQAPVFADAPEVLRAVLADTFDPRHVVYLPREVQPQVHAAAGASIHLGAPRFSAGRLQVEVEAAANSLLVVSQTYYHSWRAYVDGRRVALWPANYAFQALEVPPGQHQVKLVYEDQAFRWGAGISLLSLAAVGAAGWWLRRSTPATRPAPAPGPARERA